MSEQTPPRTDELSRAARAARAGPLRDQARDRGPGRDARARPRLPARGRPPADRGRARPREDAHDQDDRAGARRELPAHPVHARPRPVGPRRDARLPAVERHFDTELGPVFCNFLLADEINRAPAKVQSALLEVMQERQVTIAQQTHPVPEPFLVMATQNPIESEGTYPLPEAQVDRFMLKILVGYPEHDEELTVVQRSLVKPPELRRVLELERLRDLQASAAAVYVDPGIVSYTVDARDRDAGSRRARPRPPRAVHLLRRQPARPDQPRPVGARARVPPRAGLRRRRRTSRRSRRTRCATGSCSATRRSPSRWTPTRSSTRCSAKVRAPELDLSRREAAA